MTVRQLCVDCTHRCAMQDRELFWASGDVRVNSVMQELYRPEGRRFCPVKIRKGFYETQSTNV